MPDQPRVTPRFIRKIVAHPSGAIDFTSCEVVVVFDHLPAKGKNVDWKKAAQQLGEDLLAAQHECNRLTKKYDCLMQVLLRRDQMISKIMNGSELALAAWLRASIFRFFIPSRFRSAAK
jgi:hypothetical protein